MPPLEDASKNADVELLEKLPTVNEEVKDEPMEEQPSDQAELVRT